MPSIVETPSEPCSPPSAPADVTVWRGRWASEANTEAFARQLATCPALAHATLALHGDLGAGKTTLVRHLLRALGVRGRIKSPTYAVVEPHSATDCPLVSPGEPLLIWHFDFYRFNDPREWEDAGFREVFATPGLKLVEWPERAGHFLPPIDLDIHLQPDDVPHQPQTDTEPDEARWVQLTARTRVGRQLLTALHDKKKHA